MSKALRAEISALKDMVRELAAEVRVLKQGRQEVEVMMSPERLLRIKMIARADAMGDPRPRRQWNRERRAEREERSRVSRSGS